MVKLKGFEAEAAPQGALRDVQEAYGRISARDISPDDPITPDKLMPKGATSGGLDASVAPGKRAFTIKGSKIMGSGGLITPGCRVDVLVTYPVPNGKNDEKINKIILENVPILTTGTERETKIGKDGVETTEGDMIEHRRLQVDARKWLAGKLAPKKYGDKTDHNVAVSGKLEISWAQPSAS